MNHIFAALVPVDLPNTLYAVAAIVAAWNAYAANASAKKNLAECLLSRALLLEQLSLLKASLPAGPS
jgi:hypothetical protein